MGFQSVDLNQESDRSVSFRDCPHLGYLFAHFQSKIINFFSIKINLLMNSVPIVGKKFGAICFFFLTNTTKSILSTIHKMLLLG